MSQIDQIYKKVNEDMLKIEELEKKDEYVSVLTILKDQITFLEGYLVGEKNPAIITDLNSILRDRRILIRVFENSYRVATLNKSTDDRIANLVHKISQIEKELQIKKDGV